LALPHRHFAQCWPRSQECHFRRCVDKSLGRPALRYQVKNRAQKADGQKADIKKPIKQKAEMQKNRYVKKPICQKAHNQKADMTKSRYFADIFLHSKKPICKKPICQKADGQKADISKS
jgi:hypothetical protein